jgi:phosphate transport system substrate-binding protein
MKKLTAFLLAAGLTAAAQANTITGAGATFPAPLYSKWAENYHRETGNKVNYAPVGSSGGIKQIDSKTVDFGATDDPVSKTDLDRKGQYQFPTAIGALVAAINLPGIETRQMILDGPTLADIYQGRITRWRDPAIQRLNPGLALPDMAITVVVRADGSGTTFVFTDYLSKVSSSFKQSTGVGKTVNWQPKSLVAGRGNAGVAAMVSKISGSIGYVEYAFAKQARLAYTGMVNRLGETVMPGRESFARSAAAADWSVPGMAVDLNNQDGWPITAATFIIVYRQAHGRVQAMAKFFDWVFAKGDAAAEELDYIPLPESVKQRVRDDFKRLGFL